METSLVTTAMITNPAIVLIPLVCFFLGVIFSDVMRMHEVPRLHLYIMSVPVGLFMLGMLINVSHVEVESTLPGGVLKTETRYGYLRHFSDYMMFIAIVVFLGTAVPTLFESVRRGVLKNVQEQIPGDGKP